MTVNSYCSEMEDYCVGCLWSDWAAAASRRSLGGEVRGQVEPLPLTSPLYVMECPCTLHFCLVFLLLKDDLICFTKIPMNGEIKVHRSYPLKLAPGVWLQCDQWWLGMKKHSFRYWTVTLMSTWQWGALQTSTCHTLMCDITTVEKLQFDYVHVPACYCSVTAAYRLAFRSEIFYLS